MAEVIQVAPPGTEDGSINLKVEPGQTYVVEGFDPEVSDYSRDGDDLIIDLDDEGIVVLEEYFNQATGDELPVIQLSNGDLFTMSDILLSLEEDENLEDFETAAGGNENTASTGGDNRVVEVAPPGIEGETTSIEVEPGQNYVVEGFDPETTDYLREEDDLVIDLGAQGVVRLIDYFNQAEGDIPPVLKETNGEIVDMSEFEGSGDGSDIADLDTQAGGGGGTTPGGTTGGGTIVEEFNTGTIGETPPPPVPEVTPDPQATPPVTPPSTPPAPTSEATPPVDTVPEAADEEATLEEGSTITGTVLSAADDFGADGAAATPITNPGTYTGSLGGTLVLAADGTYTYTAPDNLDHSNGQTYAEEFAYTISDADGSTSTATFSLNLTDTGITASNDTDTVAEGEATVDGSVVGNASAESDSVDPNGYSLVGSATG
ncbi:MAG: Ig-like domain-containing protein, partial [Rhodospirillales bacterium]|nr:Ig-like domain-containing protein [Rhodospirillales bacterium]